MKGTPNFRKLPISLQKKRVACPAAGPRLRPPLRLLVMCLPLNAVLAALAKAEAPGGAGAGIGGIDNTHGMSGGPAIGNREPSAESDEGLISQEEARHLDSHIRKTLTGAKS